MAKNSLNHGSLEDVVSLLRYGLERAGQPPTRIYLCSRLGRILWREQRKPKEAQVVLNEAALYDNDDRDVRRMRIEIATALDDWGEVAELLKLQLQSAAEVERPAILVSLAKLAYDELDRIDEGLQFARAALSESQDYIPALSLIADRSFRNRQWALAREALEHLLELEGVHARSDDRLRLAVSLLELGHTEEAFDGLRRLRNEGSFVPELCSDVGQGERHSRKTKVLATLVNDLVDDAFAVEPALLTDVLAALSAEEETMSAARILEAALIIDGDHWVRGCGR